MSITSFTGWFRDSGFTGRLLATILASSTSYTVWPLYIAMERVASTSSSSFAYLWGTSVTYFTFWVWLILLLTREGKRYPGMILDSVCGGLLVTVAALLRGLPMYQGSSQVRFGVASWVVLLSGAVLVFRNSLQQNQMHKNPGRAQDGGPR